MSQVSLSHPAPVSQASAPASDVLIGKLSTSARSNQHPTSKLADPSLDLLAANGFCSSFEKVANSHRLLKSTLPGRTFPCLVPTYIELTHSIPPPPIRSPQSFFSSLKTFLAVICSLSLKGKVTFSSITGVSGVFGAQLTLFDNSASWW